MNRLPHLLLLLILIGLLSYLLTVDLKPDAELTDILPADTIATVESKNIVRAWEGWQRSFIGRKLKDPDLPRMLELIGQSDFRLAEFKSVAATLDRVVGAPFFSSLVAKNGVIALLAEPHGQALDRAALLNNLVLIVPSGSGFSPQHQLEPFFGSLRSATTAVYQGIALVNLVFKSGQTITFCQYHRMLICAMDPQTVKRCLDQALNRMVRPGSGLQGKREYQRLKNRFNGQADFFLYTDLAALSRQLPKAGIGEIQALGLVPHHVALVHQAEAGHDRLSLIAQVPEEQLTALVDRYQLAAPVDDPVSWRISQETQLYLWMNWINLKKLWRLGLENFSEETTELMSFLAERISENTGKTIDEFFDAFGSQFGVFINEQRVPTQSMQSVACLYIEVQDQQQVDGLLKRLLTGLQRVKVVTSGTEIISVIMAGGLLSPAYALWDNHLILADSVGLIEQVQRQGGVRPANSDQRLGPARERAGNLFLFVRADSVAQRLISMLTVLTKETKDQTRILSPRNRWLLEHAVIPFLRSLQGVETSSLRGYGVDDELLLEVDFAAKDGESRIF